MNQEIENTKRTLERLSRNENQSSGQVLTNSNLKNPRVEISKKAFETEERKHLETIYGKKAVSEVLDPPKKKLDNLDKYLIFTFTSLILYTIVSQILFYVYQIEMAVLTGCFFAAFGGEILMCALIKKLKLHKEAELTKGGGEDYGD